ncbi:hypothetical protein AAVH_27012 [Aphelenchoides avenae]|nr:hypothetical protein AAVH_27012 [Aphelenchus avenae]
MHRLRNGTAVVTLLVTLPPASKEVSQGQSVVRMADSPRLSLGYHQTSQRHSRRRRRCGAVPRRDSTQTPFVLVNDVLEDSPINHLIHLATKGNPEDFTLLNTSGHLLVRAAHVLGGYPP